MSQKIVPGLGRFGRRLDGVGSFERSEVARRSIDALALISRLARQSGGDPAKGIKR